MRKLLLLLISLVLIFGFGGCKKSPTEPTEPKTPPVEYDETNNTVAIPDATIITNGVSYKEKAPMLEDGLAVVKLVVESDTLLYFYTPLQGDIDSLTPISSLEALQKAYFSRLEDMRGEQTPVMITINPLSSGDIEVTNEAFRCAAVEGGSSQPVILPARTLFDLNLISVFQNQWGEFLTFNKKAVDTLEFHSSDSLLLYGSVARLGIFGPAIASVLMSENYDFISKVQEAFEANPSLYTRICLADELDIIFFAVKLVLGSSGTDFFSSKLTQSVVSILADVTHQGLENIITAKSVPEATGSIFNTVLKDIPQAMLNSMTSTRNSPISTSSSTRSISVAIVLKALVTVVSGSELVVGGYQSLTAAPFGKWVASNNPPSTPSEPSGPSTGDVGTSYSFSTSTTDPDGDNIAYQFNWGDANISSWSSYVSSGTSVSMSHSYSFEGTYTIRAQAKDINGTESGWSSGHLIEINGSGGSPGTQKWAFSTGKWLQSSPAIGSDGIIYVGSWDNKLYAINPDGTQKWVFSTEGSAESSPAIGADGTIYVGSDDNKLYAINPDGTQKWAFSTGHRVESSPAIGSDGTIYVGSYDNKLYAVNPDGSQKWAFSTGNYVESSPAIGSDGTIYVGSWDNKLYAINPDGTQKWAFSTGYGVESSPAIGSDGTIYVGSSDENLYAINPDGTEKWAFSTGNYVYSSPAIGLDGTIYVGSWDNKLYAINPDGSQKWAFSTPNDVFSSPAIGSDGIIYVGSDDGNLYAIYGSSGGLANTPWPMFHHDLKHSGRVGGP